MIVPFFATAVQSPRRQYTFRALVIIHLLVLLGSFWVVQSQPRQALPVLGLIMLIAGIVEGSLLIGWRLTQLPKSRALEFLLASPLPPYKVFLAELAVGITRLLFITLVGLPFYFVLLNDGFLAPVDLLQLLLLPFTSGLACGITLIAWAYEPLKIRRVVERIVFGLIFLYLVVGIIAGEHLVTWLTKAPESIRTTIMSALYVFHAYNPFANMYFGLLHPAGAVLNEFLVIELIMCTYVGLLITRSAYRMEGHFQERHYSPITVDKNRQSKTMGDAPLAWWAVKRVSEYSGKVNLWLAGGFGLIYGCHLLAGDYWPVWMGRGVFLVFDRIFGVGGVVTALVVLAAVPAAFQYGLWDSSAQDRCRRLELLLLTELQAKDFWDAAFAAAWQRGKGYMFVAAFLWIAAFIGGYISPWNFVLAPIAAMLLWLFYFTLGFRAFTKGTQANNLGLLLTAIIPLVTWALFRSGCPLLASLTPPGMVYAAGNMNNTLYCLPGIFFVGFVTMWIERQALQRCLLELKLWYEKFHGQKVVD